MDTINRPQMVPAAKGENFKTFDITAEAGMVMPDHYATQEAVVIVKEGEATLKTPEGNHEFKPGTVFVLPAKMKHSLEIKKDFKAVAVMGVDSEIKFN